MAMLGELAPVSPTEFGPKLGTFIRRAIAVQIFLASCRNLAARRRPRAAVALWGAALQTSARDRHHHYPAKR